jgi:hypothetical protein
MGTAFGKNLQSSLWYQDKNAGQFSLNATIYKQHTIARPLPDIFSLTADISDTHHEPGIYLVGRFLAVQA